jgi:hypothetical protein
MYLGRGGRPRFFRAREREAKKSAKKELAQKTKAPCAKEKSVHSRFSSLCRIALEARFQTPKPIGSHILTVLH